MANFRWQVGGCGCNCESVFTCSKTFSNAPCLLGEDLTKNEAVALLNAWDSKYKNFGASFSVLTTAQNSFPPSYLKARVQESPNGNIPTEDRFAVSGQNLYPSPEFAFFNTTASKIDLEDKLANIVALDEEGWFITACATCESLDSLYTMKIPIESLTRSFAINSSSYTSVITRGSSSTAYVTASSTVTFSATDSYTAVLSQLQPPQTLTFRRNNARYVISPELVYYRFFSPSTPLIDAFKEIIGVDSASTCSNSSLVGVTHPYPIGYGGLFQFTSSAPVLYRKQSIGGSTYYFRLGPATVSTSPTGSLLVGGQAGVSGIDVSKPPLAPTIQNNILQFQNVSFDVIVDGPFSVQAYYGETDITEEDYLANATPENTVDSFVPYNYIETIKTELQSILDNDITSLIAAFYKPISQCFIGIPTERLAFGRWKASDNNQTPDVPPRFQDCIENE